MVMVIYEREVFLITIIFMHKIYIRYIRIQYIRMKQMENNIINDTNRVLFKVKICVIFSDSIVVHTRRKPEVVVLKTIVRFR